ncbi:MAG TPA: hypothetical protein VNH82_05205 [Candidatus Dormibacteraeota bacterium]|nr:hypothetical protein [Candidatus Dormibacteraeota bacterium]
MKPTNVPGARQAKDDHLLPPGGRIEIQQADQSLVVTELVAGLRKYRKGSWEITPVG